MVSWWMLILEAGQSIVKRKQADVDMYVSINKQVTSGTTFAPLSRIHNFRTDEARQGCSFCRATPCSCVFGAPPPREVTFGPVTAISPARPRV